MNLEWILRKVRTLAPLLAGLWLIFVQLAADF